MTPKDWDKLAAKEIKPPMIPKSGTGNFDTSFTSMPPVRNETMKYPTGIILI